MEKNSVSDLDLIKQLERAVGRKLPQKGYKEIMEEDKLGFALYPADSRYPGRVRGINLSGLDLKAIPEVVSSFQHMEGLKLYDNEISDISPLSGQTNLMQLDFRGNQVRDLSPLSGLYNLTQLLLNQNQVSDLSPLARLTNLTKLTFWNNHVSDLSPLAELVYLTLLDIGGNQVSDLSPLAGLSNLKQLSFIGNKVSELSPLSGLTNLTLLRFEYNKVSNLSPLAGLTNLTLLSLSINQVSNLSPLARLANLTLLEFGGNRVSELSPLARLTNLTQLWFNSNQVSDLSPLAGLTNLAELNIGGNKVSDLSPLARLTNLTQLSFSTNQVSDISPLAGLTNLTELSLGFNQVSNLSPLAGLTNLAELDLESNQVSDLSPLAGLTRLQKVDARDNRITSLPGAILDLDLELDVKADKIIFIGGYIYLKGNPLEQPPPEIIKQGKDAVRAYFKTLEQEKDRVLPLQEVKVLLVGDGGAGKTCLVKRLLGKGFNPQENQTDGINIDTWTIKPGTADKQTIHIHLWDFGGQEIMHATHQFFLSKRSLYILVLDGRRDEKTEYWLKHIESFGGSSPVLVVLNKIDQQPGFDVNRKFLEEKYANIKGFFPVSCAIDQGIDALVEALRKELPKVELVNTQWPGSWFKVKQKLQEMTDAYISYGQYRAICRSMEIEKNNIQDHLLDFLHDLGVVLHFSDAPLEDTHVLQPAWATGAVYKIINSNILAANKGVLHKDDLPSILKKTGDDDLDYPKEKYPYITGLMCKFEICYRVDDGRVLLPDLLAVPEPAFDFDYEHALRFIVEYDFLPRSVLPRFIVHMYKDIEDDLQWRTGVVLTDPDFRARAAVKADYEARRIYFYVSGEQRRDYFACLLFTLRSINRSFEKLKSRELIPIPGENDPIITVAYQQLVHYEQKGIDIYMTAESDKEYRVKDLLGTVTGERAITEEEILKYFKKVAEEKDTKESLAKKANDAIILRPNILGVGIDLNKIFDKMLAWVKAWKK